MLQQMSLYRRARIAQTHVLSLFVASGMVIFMIGIAEVKREPSKARASGSNIEMCRPVEGCGHSC